MGGVSRGCSLHPCVWAVPLPLPSPPPPSYPSTPPPSPGREGAGLCQGLQPQGLRVLPQERGRGGRGPSQLQPHPALQLCPPPGVSPTQRVHLGQRTHPASSRKSPMAEAADEGTGAGPAHPGAGGRPRPQSPTRGTVPELQARGRMSETPEPWQDHFPPVLLHLAPHWMLKIRGERNRLQTQTPNLKQTPNSVWTHHAHSCSGRPGQATCLCG